jgi:hypothetical protein
MTKDMAWGIVRAVLAGGAGYLAGKGIADAAVLNEVIGAVGVIFAAAWSIWAKKSAA